MARVSTFAHDGLYLERGRLALTSPLRTSAVVASLFAVGLAVDQVQLSVVLCIGALFTGLADNGEAYPRRARSMAATALWCTVAATLGAAVADVQLIHLVVGFVVAAMCGYVGVLGPRSAVNGFAVAGVVRRLRRQRHHRDRGGNCDGGHVGWWCADAGGGTGGMAHPPVWWHPGRHRHWLSDVGRGCHWWSVCGCIPGGGGSLHLGWGGGGR